MLSKIFDQKITTFPGSRPSHAVQGRSVQHGYAMTYQTSGQRAFLFMTPVGNWLWNDEKVETIHTLETRDQTYIFDVEVTKDHIYISDVLVYDGLSIASRDHLERKEAARKWAHLYLGSKTQDRVCADTRSFKSAYPDYIIHLGNGMSISVKNTYPPVCRQHIWDNRPTCATGLLFVKLLDTYRTYKSRGTLVWVPQATKKKTQTHT